MTSDAFDGVEIQTGPEPTRAVIWLHGLGADGHDFEPIVPELVRPDWPPIRFVFPHAPIQPVTINGGMRMRSWYDILGFDRQAQQDEAGLRASMRFVDGLIEREIARGIKPEHIFLAGFSQGGAVVLNGGLRQAHRLAGIIALSTYLAMADRLADEASEANRQTPIFMAHGTFDPVLALPLAEHSRGLLEAQGYAVQWQTYPMAHAVSPQEIHDLQAWLGARLAE